MGGGVDIDRTNGHITVFNGPNIGIRAFVVEFETSGEPPVRTPVGVDSFFKLFDPTPVGLAANSNAFNLFEGQAGNVDVEGNVFGRSVVKMIFKNDVDDAFGGGKVGVGGKIGQRKTHGGHPFNGGFHGGAHGSGIKNADGGVEAVIDAGKNEVGFAVQNNAGGHFDAVGGRSRAGVSVDAVAKRIGFETQGLADADGMTHAALRTVGRNDDHFPKTFGHLGQCMYAFGVYAVVVAYQNQCFRHYRDKFAAQRYEVSRKLEASIYSFVALLPMLNFCMYLLVSKIFLYFCILRPNIAIRTMKTAKLTLLWTMACAAYVSAQDCTVPNPQISEVDGLLTLNETFDSYQWYKDGQEIVGATAATLPPTEVGTYTVKVSKKSEPEYFYLASRTPKLHSDKLDISPNPGNGKFIVKAPNDGKLWNLVVVSTLGETVQQKSFRGESETLDLTPLPDGAYYVRMTDGIRNYTAKVIYKK